MNFPATNLHFIRNVWWTRVNLGMSIPHQLALHWGRAKALMVRTRTTTGTWWTVTPTVKTMPVASVSRASAVARSEGPTVHLAPRVHGLFSGRAQTIAGTQQPLQRVPFTVGNLCQREEPLLTAETPDTISGCHWPEKMAPRQAESWLKLVQLTLIIDDLSIYLSFYLSIHPSVYLSIYPSVCLSIYLI